MEERREEGRGRVGERKKKGFLNDQVFNPERLLKNH